MTEENVRKLADNVSRGDQAKLVLNNSVYQEAMIKIEAELISRLRDSDWNSVDEREEVYRRLQTVKYLESYIEKVMSTGVVAKEKLSAFARLRENAKKLTGL